MRSHSGSSGGYRCGPNLEVVVAVDVEVSVRSHSGSSGGCSC